MKNYYYWAIRIGYVFAVIQLIFFVMYIPMYLDSPTELMWLKLRNSFNAMGFFYFGAEYFNLKGKE